MNRVIIGIGSNFDKKRNIEKAIDALRKTKGIEYIGFSQFIETKSIDFPGPDFLNGIALFDSPLSFDELNAKLKDIETQMGRTAEDKKAGIVRIDIDIIIYNGEKYKDDYKRPYFQPLLISIATKKI